MIRSIFIIVFLLLANCIIAQENLANNNNQQQINLIGSYTGDFGNTKITILFTKVNLDRIEGRSVVKGYGRFITGLVHRMGNTIYILASEPSGDAHDGGFVFAIDASNPQQIKGSWTPYNPTKKITAKEFYLQKNGFIFLTDVGKFPQASKILLNKKELIQFTNDEMELMLNEIYARRGYCFTNKKWREIFEDKDWYIPIVGDTKILFSEIETKNSALIQEATTVHVVADN